MQRNFGNLLRRMFTSPAPDGEPPSSGMGGQLVPLEGGNGMRVSDADTAAFHAWADANPPPFKVGQIVHVRGQRFEVLHVSADALHGPRWRFRAIPLPRDRATYTANFDEGDVEMVEPFHAA